MGGRIQKAFVALAAISIVVSSCSGDDIEVDGLIEPSTVDALDAAVGPAAQALLDAQSLEVATLWFDEDGERIRTDWLDYRADNTFLLVTQLAGLAKGDVEAMAVIQLAGERFCATSGANVYCDVDDPTTNEPWDARESPPMDSNATRIPISLDLEAMATVSSAEGIAADNLTATRREGAGGDVVWALVTTLDDAPFTREWTIASDGSLRTYLAGSDTGLPFGLYSRTQLSFVIAADPIPIAPPEIGMVLDLDTLNLPADLPRFEG